MALRPDGCGNALDSMRFDELVAGTPNWGCLSPVGANPHRVIGSASYSSDHDGIQQRAVKEPAMVSGDLHPITARLGIFRDILIELAAALPPDRAAGAVTAIGNRLTERLGDTEIHEPTDVAIDSDLAPLFAALHHRRLQQQST